MKLIFKIIFSLNLFFFLNNIQAMQSNPNIINQTVDKIKISKESSKLHKAKIIALVLALESIRIVNNHIRDSYDYYYYYPPFFNKSWFCIIKENFFCSIIFKCYNFSKVL